MKLLLITVLTVGAAISIARAIDNDGALHFIHLVVGEAE